MFTKPIEGQVQLVPCTTVQFYSSTRTTFVSPMEPANSRASIGIQLIGQKKFCSWIRGNGIPPLAKPAATRLRPRRLRMLIVWIEFAALNRIHRYRIVSATEYNCSTPCKVQLYDTSVEPEAHARRTPKIPQSPNSP